MSDYTGALNDAGMPPVPAIETSTSVSTNTSGLASQGTGYDPTVSARNGSIFGSGGSVNTPDGGFTIGPSSPATEQNLSPQEQALQDAMNGSQAATGNAQDATGGDVEVQPDETGRIPYERFKQVNDRYRETEAQLAELKAAQEALAPYKPFIEAGLLNDLLQFQTPEALRMHLLQEQGQAAEQKVVQEQSSVLAQIDAQLRAIDEAEENGFMDSMAAESQRQAWQGQRALLEEQFQTKARLAKLEAELSPIHQERQAQALRTQAEAQIAQLKTQFPHLDDDAVRRELLAGRGQEALAEAERTHNRGLSLLGQAQALQAQQAIASRANVAQQRAQTAPVVATPSSVQQGGTAPVPQDKDGLNRLREQMGLPPIR